MTHSILKASAVAFCACAALMFTSCNGGAKKAAQIEEAVELPEGICKYANDGFDLYWVRDNAESSKNKASLFAGATDEMVEELGLTDGIPASMSTFLIQQDGKNLLFDTGMGNMLLPNLAVLGVNPEDVDAVFITHLHGDHIGGLTKDGNAVFTNAKLYLGREEYEAWMAMDESRSASPKAALAPYQENMVLFEFDDVLPYGVKALDSVGHTPGHTSFLKGNVLIAGDIMHGVALQMAHPELNASFDMDQEKAAASRLKMINMAKEGKLLLCGMHFPDGGTVDFR